MKVKDLIEHLKTIDSELKFGVSEYHEYWGTVYREIELSDLIVKNADINGPKECSEKCLVIDR